jgi:hypothetical protein
VAGRVSNGEGSGGAKSALPLVTSRDPRFLSSPAAYTVFNSTSGSGCGSIDEHPCSGPGPELTTLLVAYTNSQRSPLNTTSSTADAVAAVAAGVAETAAALAAEHATWWSEFWSNTSFFSFDGSAGPGVTRLEQFAHIAGYRWVCLWVHETLCIKLAQYLLRAATPLLLWQLRVCSPIHHE